MSENELNRLRARRWDFRFDGETWTWQRIDPDGSVSAPVTHFAFGRIINSAVAAGFSPKRDNWLLEDTHSVTVFEPGQEPRVIEKPD